MSSEMIKKDNADVVAEERSCAATYAPRVDIVELDQELLLYADMPGVAPDDLDVRYENGELTLVGKVAQRHHNAEFLYTGYGVGDFYRSFSIGEAIDAEKITAEVKDGVLTVHLPKTEAVRPRRIDVKAG